MRITKTRFVGGVTTATVAMGLLAAGTSPAQTYDYNLPKDKTIDIVMKGKDPLFKGPKSIQRGAKLTIDNTTSPKKIGPHTFTLIDPSLLPKGKKELKACFHFAGVCGTILHAHKANPKTGAVKKPLVKAGKKGWDTEFTETKKGDSFVFLKKDETFGQKVTAKKGTTLFYFCDVHPFMQGKIKVK